MADTWDGTDEKTRVRHQISRYRKAHPRYRLHADMLAEILGQAIRILAPLALVRIGLETIREA